MELIIASNNQNKLSEIKAILGDSFDSVISMSDAGLDIDIEENGDTFLENALIKARTVSELTGKVALGDDSGLVVEALGGAPGVYSARYANAHGDYDKNNALLLKNMEGMENRKAKFTTVMVMYFPGGNFLFAEGEATGSILKEKKGKEGFGYDPVFFSDELNITFAEASSEQKNAVSHRAKALKNLLKVYKTNF